VRQSKGSKAAWKKQTSQAKTKNPACTAWAIISQLMLA